MGLLNFLKKIEPDKEKSPFLHTAYDAFFTFAYSPDEVTKGGVHLKDGIDLKRTMVTVVIAMQLAYIFGTYNIGHQHFVAMGQYLGFLEGFHLKLAHGLIKLLPIFIWTHVVGLGIEFYFAYKKGHAVEEGFLVSGALIPLIMPPDIPLLWLALAVALTARVQEGRLKIVKTLQLDQPKTRLVCELLSGLGLRSALFIDQGNCNLKLGARNLPRTRWVDSAVVSAYDILSHPMVVMSEAAILKLQERLLSGEST